MANSHFSLDHMTYIAHGALKLIWVQLNFVCTQKYQRDVKTQTWDEPGFVYTCMPRFPNNKALQS